MTPEKKIQNKIIKILEKYEKLGFSLLFFRRQAGGLSYHKGLPDLWFVLNGRHYEIEVKAVGGELSPLQYKWKEKFERAHCTRKVFDDPNEFEKFLKDEISKGP